MLSFRDIDVDRIEEVEHLVRWANDTTLRHLFQQFDSDTQSQERLSLDAPRLQRMLRRAIERGKVVQLILWQGQVVGEVTVEIDPTMLVDASPNTAWLGIVIGEESARGRGLGRLAMEHIEELAKTLGAKHAQIGVFEFNTRARRLYETLGYEELTTLTDFTWWKGKRWSDIRMGKPL
jgi:RimJ/RimL family protein N-acetyltransferase